MSGRGRRDRGGGRLSCSLPMPQSRGVSLSLAVVFDAAVGREGCQVFLQEAVWKEDEKMRSERKGTSNGFTH